MGRLRTTTDSTAATTIQGYLGTTSDGNIIYGSTYCPSGRACVVNMIRLVEVTSAYPTYYLRGTVTTAAGVKLNSQYSELRAVRIA